jgi:hypothetical protein
VSPAGVLTVAIAALSVLRALGQSAEPAPLRQVDWPSVLAADPALVIDTQVQPPPFAHVGPYVRLVTPTADQPAVGGFALVDDVLYGDLDADGAEEGVILLASGGTAGVIGLLVYHTDAPQPRLATALDGYKLGARIEDGMLVVFQPRYAGFEGNCCPSAEVETRYSLVGNQLIAASEQEQPFVEAQAETAQQFYSELNRHLVAEAYAFLSDEFQQAHPFDSWSSGYQDTDRVQLDDVTETPDGVSIRLTSYDREPDGQERVRRFAGTWSLVWGSAVHHWLLDAANIVEVQ